MIDTSVRNAKILRGCIDSFWLEINNELDTEHTLIFF